MPSSDYAESVILAEWAQEQCAHLDVISSWETLVSIYRVLEFLDTLSDEQRLNEFKKVIGETNKFLTRMKTGLTKARSIDDAIQFLKGHINATDMAEVKTRAQVAYNKLKQRWINMAILDLEARQEMAARKAAEEGDRDD